MSEPFAVPFTPDPDLPRPAAAAAPLRVLLVEDDPEYGRMVERALRRARPPLWVHREERLDAALGRLERERYDAMLVDLTLPDGAGRSTLGCACAVANHLPVVVLTGADDDSLALDATRSGAQDYLVKQRTHALAISGAVLRAIERHRRGRHPRLAPVEDVPTATPAARRAGALAAGAAVPAGPVAAPPVRPATPNDEVLLLEHLERALARARRRGESPGVLVAGFDDLDLVEGVLGREGVESMLERARLRLARCLRRSDTLARLDSRSFAVVVEGCRDTSVHRRIALKLRGALQAVGSEAAHRSRVIGLVSRVGLSTYPADGEDVETLLENADAARERAAAEDGIAFYATADPVASGYGARAIAPIEEECDV